MARKSKSKNFLYGIILGALLNEVLSSYSMQDIKLYLDKTKNSMITICENNLGKIKEVAVYKNLFRE